MAVTRITCPSCNSVLKLGQPLAAGKRVKCPKCAALISVPAEEVNEDEPSVPAPPRRKAGTPQPGKVKQRPVEPDEEETPSEEQEAEESPDPEEEQPRPKKRRKKPG